MRRFAMTGAALTVGTVLGVLTPLTGSTAAWADSPQHVKSTFAFDYTIQAGTFCDFAFRNVGTISENTVTLSGRKIDHFDLYVAHINTATGFTLTETDHFTEFTDANGQTKSVGIFWHLRNTEGKLVLVQAGQMVVSDEGEILKVTPSVNPDGAAVMCPALGGQPAI